EIITEKSGHLNLGIPGIMCLGTAGGCFGVSIYMSMLGNPNSALWIFLIIIPIITSIIFSAIGGLIYAFLTVTFRVNQNVVGLALTTFGAGFAQFFIDKFVTTMRFAKASKIIRTPLPFAEDLGWFGEVFLSYGFLVYLAIAIAIISAIVLRKTRIGLNLRAVGENPATADAVGINVTAYKYGAILIGSAIAGLGGLLYVMEYNSGTFDNTLTIQSFGWLAIALVIFTMWKPDLCILGSIIFGALYILGYKITGLDSLGQQELIKLLPYVVTVIVLIITSMLDSKENQPPASLGVNYFREER
ncbi:MAG: ABC transporter permease, partial [Clostridia bacterium]|nr:ABC transporter permease [Clostridia bacterium]